MTSTNNYNTIATFIHLSVFSKYFIPLGNYIVPAVLWMTNKDKSNFIDANGKEALNFQLSILLYTLILGSISIPFFLFTFFDGFSFFNFFPAESFHFNFSEIGGFRTLIGASVIGIIALIGFFIEIVCIINAAAKANKGEPYQYPFTIRFLR